MASQAGSLGLADQKMVPENRLKTWFPKMGSTSGPQTSPQKTVPKHELKKWSPRELQLHARARARVSSLTGCGLKRFVAVVWHGHGYLTLASSVVRSSRSFH